MDTAAMKKLPIGVFDSGVGGISVLRELVRLMPDENYYYRGDSGNAPYGTKPVEQIRELTMQNVDQMRMHGVKCIVVACNTATSAAIGELRKRHTDIPVIGIEPALKPAVFSGAYPDVVVMATPGTVAGNKFHDLMHHYDGEADVTALPCPGLMEYVEKGILSGEEVEQTIRKLLMPCMQNGRKIDAVVLGCTHYPFLRDSIRRVVGERPLILDGSEGTARETRRRLQMQDLLGGEGTGYVEFSFSAPGMTPLAERLLYGDQNNA